MQDNLLETTSLRLRSILGVEDAKSRRMRSQDSRSYGVGLEIETCCRKLTGVVANLMGGNYVLATYSCLQNKVLEPDI